MFLYCLLTHMVITITYPLVCLGLAAGRETLVEDGEDAPVSVTTTLQKWAHIYPRVLRLSLGTHPSYLQEMVRTWLMQAFAWWHAAIASDVWCCLEQKLTYPFHQPGHLSYFRGGQEGRRVRLEAFAIWARRARLAFPWSVSSWAGPDIS